jgi:hypothetical protein
MSGLRHLLLRFARHGCAVAAAALVAGCVTPWNTTLPTAYPRHPALERRAFEFHDPFADESAGPDMQIRPRGYDTQRTAPRRAKEGAILQGVVPTFAPSPVLPATDPYYPNAIRP